MVYIYLLEELQAADQAADMDMILCPGMVLENE
jgi:hypothetical protein